MPAGLDAQVIAVVADAADRLRNPDTVARAWAAARAQTAFPRSVNRDPLSLAQGEAGIALTCSFLDECFPDKGWDRTGRHYLSVAASHAEARWDISTGLFSGVAGLGFAAFSLSRNGTRYRRLLASVDEALIPRVAARARRLGRVTREGIPVGDFDLISGLAGTGAYLLCRVADPGAAEALEVTLRCLVTLCRDIDGRPRWWTPARFMGDEDTAARYPDGYLNCGLAHGIPGPLALMAIALAAGVRVSGLAEAVNCAASWLIEHRADDAWGVNWPVAVCLAPDGSTKPPGSDRPPTRSAWCYGAPGVARALWLAGAALDRPAWRALAVEAMEAVYQRPDTIRSIDSPTFCHGAAGLLQVTLRFAHDTGLPSFAAEAVRLVQSLLSAFEPDSMLGFRNLEPGGRRIDQPGLLDGSPGVLLALTAAARNVEPCWDRAFLLA
ncbi:MAG: lanthionine synthetase C family protein [Streptosporangiaceae bacterium]